MEDTRYEIIKDKKAIKSGMTFRTKDGKTYLKIGDRVILIDLDPNNIKSFESINEEDIMHIFKTNGELYIDKCDKEIKEEDNE